ncbi:hypothetical protein Tco_1155274 [Tanacetum coccineum]
MHLRPQGNQLVTSTQKEELLLFIKVEIVEMAKLQHLDSITGNGRQISTLKNVLHICLLKNVHQKCCHQRRVEILTIGVMKALKETQPHKSLTRTISNLEYEKPYTPYSDPRRIHSMKQRQEEQ